MGVYDQASHYAVKLDPEGFFAWRLPQFTAQFTFLGWLDVILHGARSETSSNSWKLSVMRVVSLSA